MSAYLMDSAKLSKLTNIPRAFALPTPEDVSSLYDTLLDENLKSVGYRYPDAQRISDWCEGGEGAYIYDADALPMSAREALDLLKEYDYQSCEHPTYADSFARIYVGLMLVALEPLAKEEAKREAVEREAKRAAVVAALKPVDLYPKQTAAILRKLLRAAFPSCKFSIVTERGSMVSSIRISWIDGPSSSAVDAIAQQFKAGNFDGMTDSYDYDRNHYVQVDGVNYRPCCQYVFTSRAISAKLAAKCVAQVAEYWGGVTELPKVIDGGHGEYRLEPQTMYYTPVRADLDGHHYSWRACIHRAAEDRTEFSRTVEA